MEDLQTSMIIISLANIVMLIVFCVMAANVNAIKVMLRRKETLIKYIDVFNAGELKEYQEKKVEALDCYTEAYFLISKYTKANPQTPDASKHKEMISAKIKLLGGVVREIA